MTRRPLILVAAALALAAPACSKSDPPVATGTTAGSTPGSTAAPATTAAGRGTTTTEEAPGTTARKSTDTSKASTDTSSKKSTTTTDGDDSDTDTTGGDPSNADFIEQANAVCRTLEDDQAALTEPSKTASDAEARAYFTEVLALAQTQVDDLTALGEPPADAETWADFLATEQALVDRFAELLDDPALPVEQIFNDEEGQRLDGELDDLVEAFGVSDCN